MREPSHPGERQPRRGCVHRAERGGDVLRHRTIDIADEAEREVELLVVLPTRAGDPAAAFEQRRADGRWWAQGDEQARHRALL